MAGDAYRPSYNFRSRGVVCNRCPQPSDAATCSTEAIGPTFTTGRDPRSLQKSRPLHPSWVFGAKEVKEAVTSRICGSGTRYGKIEHCGGLGRIVAGGIAVPYGLNLPQQPLEAGQWEDEMEGSLSHNAWHDATCESSNQHDPSRSRRRGGRTSSFSTGRRGCPQSPRR